MTLSEQDRSQCQVLLFKNLRNRERNCLICRMKDLGLNPGDHYLWTDVDPVRVLNLTTVHLKEPLKEDTTSTHSPPATAGPTCSPSGNTTRAPSPQGTKSPEGVEKTVRGTPERPPELPRKDDTPPSYSPSPKGQTSTFMDDMEYRRDRLFHIGPCEQKCSRFKNCLNYAPEEVCMGWRTKNFKKGGK